MSDDGKARRASVLLFEKWRAGEKIDAIPQAIRPATREEGYAVQAELMNRTGSRLFGWKIAATSEAGQRHIGVDGPLAGRIFEENVRLPSDPIGLAGNLMRVAEVEFAFRFGRRVEPREALYSVNEVLDAVDSLHPAIEIPDSRYLDFVRVGAPQLIADDACAHLFILGAATGADWRSVDLARHAVEVRMPDGSLQTGLGSNVLGDPRVALAWLVNELSALGIPLEEGQAVTTGTCIVPIAVKEGDRVAADYGPFGTISAHFVA